MSYPLSSAVSAGDATLAAHYNNLRSDVLNLGQAAADAVTLAALLERYESRLTLERLNTDQVRVPASATIPVCLVISGYMLQAVANVDLASGAKPSGAAADYYVFANRVAASNTFTLSVSESATEIADKRRIGRFYWNGSSIVKDSVRTENSVNIKALLYYVDPQICDGRLTISTGVPSPSEDINSSPNLYFTPFRGNRISLYAQSYGWRLYAFSELTLDISGLGADKTFDIWLYDNAGTLTLAYTEWSSASIRATALAYQDGVPVKTGAPAYRYLGTIRTSAAGVTCDTSLKRFVWNFYHPLEKWLICKDLTDSWTYEVANTWHSLNASDLNRVAFVIGLDITTVRFSAHVLAKQDNTLKSIGIGISLDATTVNNAQIMRGEKGIDTAYSFQWYGADYVGRPGIGYHYLQIIETVSGGTGTFYGDNGVTYGEIVSGGIGSIAL